MCAIYWPKDESTRQQYGPFDVQLVDSVNETANVTVRQFQLTKSGGVSNSCSSAVLICDQPSQNETLLGNNGSVFYCIVG